jgi:hypothetical protein
VASKVVPVASQRVPIGSEFTRRLSGAMPKSARACTHQVSTFASRGHARADLGMAPITEWANCSALTNDFLSHVPG